MAKEYFEVLLVVDGLLTLVSLLLITYKSIVEAFTNVRFYEMAIRGILAPLGF